MDPNVEPLAVTDTHALIWAISGKHKRLGRRARRQFEKADDGRCSIYIPTIALVELGDAYRKERVELSMPFVQWTRAALASGKYHEAELTAEIVLVSQRLYSIPERSDRLIAATAVALDLPLITRDPQIASVAGIECLWG